MLSTVMDNLRAIYKMTIFFFLVPLRNIFIFHMRSTLVQQGLKPLQGYPYCELNMSNAGTETGWGGKQHFSQPTKLYPVDFKKKDMGGGLWSTYLCIDHEIIFSVVSLSATTHSTTTSRCPHGFRARTSQELNLAQQWKDPHFQFYHCVQPVWARWQPLLLKEFDISLSKGHKPFQIMLLGWHNSREEDMWCTYVLPIY